MDKIFENETIEYLKSFGISNDEIFKVQKDKLKKHAISVLNLAIEAIQKEDFSLIKENTFESPPGDAWGRDDTCLNFGKISGQYLNIEDLFEKMQNNDEE